MLNPVVPIRPAPAVPERLSHCENVTRADGLAAGLAAVLAGVELSAAPGRVAAVPSTSVAPGDVVIPHRIADLEGIALVAVPGRRCPPGVLSAVGVALAAVRLVVAEQVLDAAVRHLSGRVAGGEALIRKPMVIGDVAGIRTALAALAPRIHLRPGPGMLADLHEQITAVEWELSKLFGASGFLAAGPARVLHVSRLVANCWVPVPSDPLLDPTSDPRW